MSAQIDILINTMPFFDDLKHAVQEVLQRSSSPVYTLIDANIAKLEPQAYQSIVKFIVREFEPDLVTRFSTTLHKVSYSELRKFKQENSNEFRHIKQLVGKVATMQQSSSASAEDLTTKKQLEAEIANKLQVLKGVFKQALTACLFDKLAEDFQKLEFAKQTLAALEKLQPLDFAVIISVCVENIVESGWLISWCFEESYFQQSIQKEDEVILQGYLANLEWLTKGIYEKVLMAISDVPRFYLNTKGNWRILDARMVDLELKSNANYHEIIGKIDGGGQTGVGYVLKNLPSKRSSEIQILDKLLNKWHDDFERLPNLPINMYQQMLMLSDHDHLLESIDRFFEERILLKLPEDIKKLLCLLPDLRGRLSIQRRNYESFSAEDKALPGKIAEHDTSIKDLQKQKLRLVAQKVAAEKLNDFQVIQNLTLRMIEIDGQLQFREREITTFKHRVANVNAVLTKITELEAQIADGEEQKSKIKIDNLATRVSDSVVHFIRVKRDKGTRWAKVFYTGVDGKEHYLIASELKCLAKQYIKELQSRDWKKLDADSQGTLAKHLQVRRQDQSEMRSNAEGSLRTNPIDGSGTHVLSSTEIRDAVNRNAYIDTAIGEPAEDFRDIIIAANILVYGGGSSESMAAAMNSRDATRSELAEKNCQAQAKRQDYRPNHAELLAQNLDAIDGFVSTETKFGKRDYIEVALVKLHDFVAGRTLQLTDMQKEVLHGANIPALVSRYTRKQGTLVNGYSASLSNFGLTKIRKHSETSSSGDLTDTQQAKKLLAVK